MPLRKRKGYKPAKYWESRAPELIESYDHPETWPSRNWLRSGAEDECVPRLLREHNCVSVLVVGAGSGRQYAYLSAFETRGIDISPTLVAECRRRYPSLDTAVADVLDAERFGPVDAIVSSAVLAHVEPKDVRAAIGALTRTAAKLIVIREYTWLRESLGYMWAHKYEALLSGWQVANREVTDAREDGRAELIAFRPAA